MLWSKELTVREVKLLKERLGIDQENPPNLEEVGKQFNVTRERIRNIEEKVLRKLGNQGDDDPDPVVS